MPSKTVTVTIGKNTYDVAFPNTGQFLDIRAMKSRLVDDIRGTEALDGYANLLGEMAATFTTMIPKLKKDLNASIFELDMVQSKELVDAYKDVYMPFFQEWMNVITAPKASVEPAVTANE